MDNRYAIDYAIDRPGFSVRIDGGFVDRGQWLIHGVVRYRPDLSAASRIDVEDEARREILSAVTRVSRSARVQGARSVYVSVDGDDEIAGFFRMLRRHDDRQSRKRGASSLSATS
jgi:hypothetical protein